MRIFPMIGCLTLLLSAAKCLAAPYGLDVDWIHYHDQSGLQINYDFSSSTYSGDSIAIPASAVTLPSSTLQVSFQWEAPYYLGYGPDPNPIQQSIVNGKYHLSISQPDQTAPISGGVTALGYLGSNLPAAANDWEFWSRYSGFTDVSTLDTAYIFETGAGRRNPAVISPKVSGTWFSGTHEGKQYDNLLAIALEVDGGGLDWSSEMRFIEGLDPANTTIDLRVVVSESGQTVEGFYRIDGVNSPTWNSISSFTLTAGQGAMTALEEHALPSISMHAGIAPVPEPETYASLIVGLSLIGLSRRRRHSTQAMAQPSIC